MSEQESLTNSDKDKTRKKYATAAACLLWLLSLAASFIIAPGSSLIYLPDLLLLLGFVPLLIIVRHTWPWLVFGLLNTIIGFTLQVARFLPEHSLPSDMEPVSWHLAQYHAPIIWIWMGLVCVIYGVIKLIKSLIRFCRKSKAQ